MQTLTHFPLTAFAEHGLYSPRIYFEKILNLHVLQILRQVMTDLGLRILIVAALVYPGRMMC